MGYYQDLDNDLGVDEEIAEQEREEAWAAREELKAKRVRETSLKRSIRNTVTKELEKHGIDTSKKPLRGATVEVTCLCCKSLFSARVADRNRGWAKYCSKSCKAKKQVCNI